MTALAQFFSKQGKNISGSDTAEIFFTDDILQKSRIKFFNGFDVNNIPADIDLVIYSSAYNKNNNVEMAEIAKRKILAIDLAHANAEIFNSFKKNIAVCGSHGKSTTTALLTFILKECGIDPSALIGSAVPQLKGNGLFGKSQVMVMEADEYNNKLQHYNPYAVILNNIDYDHPDFFKTRASYKQVFKDFIARVSKNGFIIANFEDANVMDACVDAQARVIDYGRVNLNKYEICALEIKNKKQYFKLKTQGRIMANFETQLIGEHNVMNATAVIATCLELKIPLQKIKKSLAKFKGLKRRMEVLGEYNKTIFIDDYAHHPTEINATLQAARLKYPNKNIICVFMPHTYTRTEALFDAFAGSFSFADEVIILPIYSSAREKKGKVSAGDLAGRIAKKNSRYISSIAQCAKYLQKRVTEKDVVILMGAGDSFRVWHELK